jgi:hypothetical protein
MPRDGRDDTWNHLAGFMPRCPPMEPFGFRAPLCDLEKTVTRRVHVELLHHLRSQPGVTVKELPGIVHQLAAREPPQCTEHLLERGPEALHCTQTEIAEPSVLVGQHTDDFGRGNLRSQPHHENMFPLVLSCGLALVGCSAFGLQYADLGDVPPGKVGPHERPADGEARSVDDELAHTNVLRAGN